jgi:hypothetical protein
LSLQINQKVGIYLTGTELLNTRITDVFLVVRGFFFKCLTRANRRIHVIKEEEKNDIIANLFNHLSLQMNENTREREIL